MFKLLSQKYNTINNLNWFLAVISFFSSLFLYLKLPHIIPTHFNVIFQPDGFGGKSSLWIFPLIFIFLKIICSEKNRYAWFKDTFANDIVQKNIQIILQIFIWLLISGVYLYYFTRI